MVFICSVGVQKVMSGEVGIKMRSCSHRFLCKSENKGFNRGDNFLSDFLLLRKVFEISNVCFASIHIVAYTGKYPTSIFIQEITVNIWVLYL